MATYTVSAGQFGAYEKALSAGGVDSVTFTGRDLKLVEITNIDGSAPIYATTDGSTPADKAAAVRWVVYPGQSVQLTPKSSGATSVNVFCRAAVTYSVADVS